MNRETIDRLLALALHEATGAPEATAAMGRLLASAEARAELAKRLVSASRCATCDHNRRELRRAVAEVQRLRVERDAARLEVRGLANRVQELEERARGSRAGDTSDDQNGNGHERENRFRRRPRPVVELEHPATCAECGAALAAGAPARVYPGGRIYGTECHGRRRSAS